MPRRPSSPNRTSVSLTEEGRHLLAATARASGLSPVKVIRVALLIHALNRKTARRHHVRQPVYGSGTEAMSIYLRPIDLAALDILTTSYCGGARSHVVEAALRAEANSVVAYMTALTDEEREQLQGQLGFNTAGLDIDPTRA